VAAAAGLANLSRAQSRAGPRQRDGPLEQLVVSRVPDHVRGRVQADHDHLAVLAQTLRDRVADPRPPPVTTNERRIPPRA
jgi:hypothetical protein